VLAGRTAIVSGASRGIGLAIARALVADGVRVAMVARTAAALEMRAAELGTLTLPIAADVTKPATVDAVVRRALDAFGAAPDILVNNAGVFTLASVDETSPADFQAAVETNLLAPFLLTRAVLPGMRARASGHLVFIGSTADRLILSGNAAYGASKFGARALLETLRREVRGSGVRATLVSPAAVDTPMWDAIDADAEPDFPPRAAMLRPEHVAQAVLFALRQPPEVNVSELRLAAT
jgi:NADP-dependent 3-hydroxy acid dehydrogenase YdfG